MPCRAGNLSLSTPGVCLLHSYCLSNKRYNNGERVMCKKEKCKEYVPSVNEALLVTPEILRRMYLLRWWEEFGKDGK